MEISDREDPFALGGGGCRSERETLAYLDGRLPDDRVAHVERHVVACEPCRETVALYAHVTSPELSAEDERLVDAIERRTAVAARALYREEEPPAARIEGRPSPRRWWIALAASVAIAAAVAVPVWKRIAAPDDVAYGMRRLRSATAARRPTPFRVTDLDYAPYEVTRSAGASDRDRDVQLALGLLEHAAAREPSVESRHALGRALIASYDFPGALEQLERARDAAPRDAGVLTDLAVALAETGDDAAAERALDAALDADPARLDALFNRAVLRARAGRLDEARSDFEAYVHLDATSGWAAEARSRM